MPLALSVFVGSNGSSLPIWNVAVRSPTVVGLKAIVQSTCSPGWIVTGVAGPDRTEKSVLPPERVKLLTCRAVEPTLNSSHCLVSWVFRSTTPKPRSQLTPSSGPVAVVSSKALRP